MYILYIELYPYPEANSHNMPPYVPLNMHVRFCFDVGKKQVPTGFKWSIYLYSSVLIPWHRGYDCSGVRLEIILKNMGWVGWYLSKGGPSTWDIIHTRRICLTNPTVHQGNIPQCNILQRSTYHSGWWNNGPGLYQVMAYMSGLNEYQSPSQTKKIFRFAATVAE